MKKIIFIAILISCALCACKPAEAPEPSATPEVTETATPTAAPVDSAAPEAFDEQKAREELLMLGLDESAADVITDKMLFYADSVDFNSFTYKHDAENNPEIKYKITITPSRFSVDSINLMDYMRLNSRREIVYQNEHQKSTRAYLGEGAVEGEKVYAVAYPNAVEPPTAYFLSLYKLGEDYLEYIGAIERGTLQWATGFEFRQYPLTMEVGKRYEFDRPDPADAVRYSKYHLEASGLKNVTINGTLFQDCVEFLEIYETYVPSGLGDTVIQTTYYSKEFGAVLERKDVISISGDYDKRVSAFSFAPSYRISDSELTLPADMLLPFIATPEVTQEPPVPDVLFDSSPMLKMPAGLHLVANGSDIVAGIVSSRTFSVNHEFCSKLEVIVRRATPNGTDVILVAGSAGFNLLNMYTSQSFAFDGDGGFNEGYSIQVSIYDLDNDGEDEILLAIGDNLVEMELLVFEIGGEGLHYMDILHGQEYMSIDKNNVITVPYGSQGLFDKYKYTSDGWILTH